MDLVIHYKKQSMCDPMLLQMNIYYWTLNYDKIDNLLIVGSYDNNAVKEINDLQVVNVFNKAINDRGFGNKLSEINIANINMPKELSRYVILNHHLDAIREHVSDEFISSHIDVFPIKKITENDLNKEPSIKTTLKKFKPKFEYEVMQKNAVIEFSRDYNKNNLPIYDHHTLMKLDGGFFNFYNKYKDKYSYAIILTYYNLLVKKEKIVSPDIINTTYKSNKFVWKNNIDYKAVNLTLPCKCRNIWDKLYKDMLKKK